MNLFQLVAALFRLTKMFVNNISFSQW